MTSRREYHDYSKVDLTGPVLDWKKIQQVFDSLTLRQKTILGLMGNGHTNKEIVARLDLPPPTVKIYTQELRHKFDLDNLAEGNVRSLITQIWTRLNSRPQLNPFDDSASNEKWGYKP